MSHIKVTATFRSAVLNNVQSWMGLKRYGVQGGNATMRYIRWKLLRSNKYY